MSRRLLPVPSMGVRWKASLWDYLVISAWIVVVSLVGYALRSFVDVDAGNLSVAGTDLVAFSVTVLPVWVYFTITQGGQRAASLGKRRTHLRVVAHDGRTPGVLRSALRSAVKLAPWQLAHLAVARMILVGDPVIITTTYAASIALVALTIGMALLDPEHRALHDRVAGTRVVALH